jgi:hypothetical protein
MSERPINDPQLTPQAPASVDASARQLASARRRRLLKIGGAAVPAALTLTSRPVMAWDCNTASMWGSVQGISTTHSSYGRSRVGSGTQQALFADETYTRANWLANTTRGGLPSSPWAALGCASGKTWPWNNFKNLKISDVIPSAITGVSTSAKIWDYLNTSTDEYGYLMVVAWLNYIALVVKTGATPGLGKCLKPQSTVALSWMGSVGSGVTGPDGRLWDKPRVVNYLKLNYIAKVS